VLVLPLSFQKNVDSLSFVCSASIGFYVCLVLKTASEASVTLNLDEHWMSNIEIWRPSGLLQCLPIFSMSLSCQMQLFEVYETFPFQSLQKMYEAVKAATSICTVMYILIGFFGYIAFYHHELSGNILVNFSPSIASDAIKIGFVLSVACSLPLIVLPCRNCLNSFLQKRAHSEAAGYLPESKYKPLTLFIVFTSMFLGIMIPSIEIVIGLIGSTIGIVICVMFPAAIFIKITKRNTTEKLIAQIMISLGFLIMILGTYANLNAMDTAKSGPHVEEKDIIYQKYLETEKPFKETFKIEKILESPKIEKPPENISVDRGKLEMIKNKLKESDANKLKMKNSNVVAPAPIVETEKPVIINKDAILKEEREIAIERQSNEAEIKKLKETKEILEKEVKEMKKELVKQNEETQKLVLQKFEEIGKKVDDMAENLLEKKAISAEAEKLEIQNEIQDTKESEKLQEQSKMEVQNKIEEPPKEKVPENMQQIDKDLAETIRNNDPIVNMLKNSYDKNLKITNDDSKAKDQPISYQVGDLIQKKINMTDILKSPDIAKNVQENLVEKEIVPEKPLVAEKKVEETKDSNEEIHNEIRKKRDVGQQICENKNR
jgi:sodium-coupled neutral amino acid transporter 10